MSKEQASPAPFWALWANPIFIRYLRARLRPAGLIAWGLIVFVVTAFAFTAVYLAFTKRGPGIGGEQFSPEDLRMLAGRVSLIPLLFIQMLILSLKGTFSVAVGITRESSEGILDYQRLTPMSPLSKIVGYLFGLPIREYALFLITVPFTITSIIIGRVPWELAGKVYLIVFTSVVLYHMTAFVAGMVVKQKIVAGLLSQFLMVILYLVLPQLSDVGYVFFEYLTTMPVFFEQAALLVSEQTMPFSREVAEFAAERTPPVKFFDLDFSHVAFTLIIQLSLIFVFIVIVHRKWRQPENHVLGKHFALLVYAGLQVLLLGNMLPLIDSGQILFSNATEIGQRLREFSQNEAWVVSEGMALAGAFGLTSLLMSLGIVWIITPSRDSTIRGLRRAKKLGLSRVPSGADACTGFWHSLLLAAIGAGTWLYFSRALFSSDLFSDSVGLSGLAFIAFPCAFVLPVLCFHSILESQGGRWLLVGMILGWLSPAFVALLMAIYSNDWAEGSIYTFAFSLLSFPFYCVQAVIHGTSVPKQDVVQTAFWVAMGFYMLAVPILVFFLRKFHRSMSQRISD